jgi:hypothetical protein
MKATLDKYVPRALRNEVLDQARKPKIRNII